MTSTPHLAVSNAARWLVTAAAILAALVAAPRAEAGVLVESAGSCEPQELERPFLRWLDLAHYVLVPDGSFSRDARGWELSDAAVVRENEPWNVRGEERVAGLRVAPGGSATSPSMCAGLEHPTLRFFARNAGSTLDPLNVDVLFEDARGELRSLRIASIVGHGRWSPTLPLPIVANLLPLLPGEQTALAFRFSSPVHGSEWVIDDVYVDPYKKG